MNEEFLMTSDLVNLGPVLDSRPECHEIQVDICVKICMKFIL